MTNDVFAISVYSLNDAFVVRKCCSRGYTMHPLVEGQYRFYGCSCEILASNIEEDEAIKLGREYSEKLAVPFIRD